jgi:hypothetical protein
MFLSSYSIPELKCAKNNKLINNFCVNRVSIFLDNFVDSYFFSVVERSLKDLEPHITNV